MLRVGSSATPTTINYQYDQRRQLSLPAALQLPPLLYQISRRLRRQRLSADIRPYTAQRGNLDCPALRVVRLHPRLLPQQKAMAPPHIRRPRDEPVLQRVARPAAEAEGRHGGARVDGGRGQAGVGRQGQVVGGGLLAAAGGVGERDIRLGWWARSAAGADWADGA